MDGVEMKRVSYDNGFSLVEVMIALVVLLIGMLGIMGMQYYAVAGNAASRELRMATNLSQDMIESLKSIPLANLSSKTDTPVSGVALTGGVNFSRSWWVVPNCLDFPVSNTANPCAAVAQACATAPGGGTVAVSAIKARTCWTDKSQTIHSVTLDSVR